MKIHHSVVIDAQDLLTFLKEKLSINSAATIELKVQIERENSATIKSVTLEWVENPEKQNEDFWRR